MTIVWEFHFARQKYRNMIKTNVKWCAGKEEEERNNELFRKWFEAWNSGKNIIWMWVITMENDVCRCHWIVSLLSLLRYLQRIPWRVANIRDWNNHMPQLLSLSLYTSYTLQFAPYEKAFVLSSFTIMNIIIIISFLLHYCECDWMDARSRVCCVCVFADVVYVIIFSFIHRERQTRRCAELVVYVQRYYIINGQQSVTAARVNRLPGICSSAVVSIVFNRYMGTCSRHWRVSVCALCDGEKEVMTMNLW